MIKNKIDEKQKPKLFALWDQILNGVEEENETKKEKKR